VAGVWSTFVDRLGVGVDLIRRNPAAVVPVAGLLASLAVALRPPAAIAATFERWPAWRDAIVVCLVGGIVAYVANDTGAAAAGFAFGMGLGGCSACRSSPDQEDGDTVTTGPIRPDPTPCTRCRRRPSRSRRRREDSRHGRRPRGRGGRGPGLRRAFLVAGIAALPVIQILGDDDLNSIVATIAAALAILGILVFWLTRQHRGGSTCSACRHWFPDARSVRSSASGCTWSSCSSWGLCSSSLFQAITRRVGTGARAGAAGSLGGGPGRHDRLRDRDRSVRRGAVLPRGLVPGAPRSVRVPGGGGGVRLAFGLIHYIPGPPLDSVLLMTVMVFTGVGLSYIYQRRGSIVAPIAAHVAFNAIGLVLIYGIG
jgi:hypothetical protein